MRAQMDPRPQVVLSAYTGYLMCDFAEYHAYVEAVLGRPVYTHEMVAGRFQQRLREAVRVRGDFARAMAAMDAAFPAPPVTAEKE